MQQLYINKIIGMGYIKEVRKALRANRFVSDLFYFLHIDDLLIRLGSKSFENAIENAIEKFRPELKKTSNTEIEKVKNEIRHSYYVCKSSPDEYFLMGLYNFDDEGKRSFVTDKFLYMTMSRLSSRKKHDEEIENKWNFYKLATPYFKRQAVGIFTNRDFDDFKRVALDIHDLILKPLDACMGKGISAVNITNEEQAKMVFDSMIEKGGAWIVEERIRQTKEMAIWCESCVNTVRFLSILNKNTGFHAIKPFLRTGRKGAIVDNAGSGGIFANVDVKSGILCTCGIDELGNRYIEHPDTHIKFEGWQIPQYNQLVDMVKEMHEKIMPTHPYIGWDLALTDKGWVVIEANWGQFVNQYIDHVGLKKEFLQYVEGK